MLVLGLVIKAVSPFYRETWIACLWLEFPATIVSSVGLACGHDARWLKVLPAGIVGVATVAFYADGRNGAVSRILGGTPPELVVGGIVSGVCALMFSGK